MNIDGINKESNLGNSCNIVDQFFLHTETNKDFKGFCKSHDPPLWLPPTEMHVLDVSIACLFTIIAKYLNESFLIKSRKKNQNFSSIEQTERKTSKKDRRITN
jgi:hypothetical protein